MFQKLVGLLLVTLAVPVISIAQSDTTKHAEEEDLGSRRLHFLCGASIHRGVHVGTNWLIPFAPDGSNKLSAEISVGIDPQLWQPVVGAAMSWLVLGKEDLGGSISLVGSFEKWGDENNSTRKRTLGLLPGLLARWGDRILSFRLGPAVEFREEIVTTVSNAEQIHTNKLVLGAEASMMF